MKKLILLFALCVFAVTGCDSDSDKSSSAPGGTFTFNASGGDGETGNGGNAGSFQILSYSDIKILRNGTVNASFSVPSYTEFLGDNPLIITTDTEISVPTGTPPTGTPYLTDADTNIYISDGDATLGEEDPVTGLKVQAGATLTFNVNNSSTTDCSINLTDDVILSGSLTTAFQSASVRDRVNLAVLTLGMFVSGINSTIDLSGADATNPADNGGNGGYLQVSTYEDIIARSSVITSGGSGAAGGTAQPVIFISQYRNVCCTGSITMNGGTGTTGAGGSSAYTQVQAAYGNVKNSADISMRGGDSAGGAGGNGGGINFIAGASSIGSIYNSGNIDARGGASESGNGGSVGSFSILVYGGEFLWSGTVTAHGGDGVTGGNGAPISIGANVGHSIMSGQDYAQGTLRIGASLDMRGGNGSATGGTGGGFTITVTGYAPYITPPSNPVELAGFGAITLNGGNGAVNGGNGASPVALTSVMVNMAPSGEIWDAGSITNEVNITAHGGTGTTGNGGNGGTIVFNSSSAQAESAVMTNSGEIDVAGGDGANGGPSGGIQLTSYRGITNTGDLTAAGGNATGNTATAGIGASGAVVLQNIGYGDITNRGNIFASGGEATGITSSGGAVGTVVLQAAEILYNYGSIYCDGGSSTDGTSASGGTVNLLSGFVGETENSASIITVEGGSGATPLVHGTIQIDLVVVTPPDGTLP